MGIIQKISNSCSCSEIEAQKHLEAEVRRLRELRDLDDLRDRDFEDACSGLGLDMDYMMYFITQLAC